MNQNPEWVKFMREQYPPGTRIRLIEMNDPYAPVPPGTEGSIVHIDDQCQLHMEWNNGRTLAVIPGVDRFSIILQPVQILKLYMPLVVKAYERNQWGDLQDEPCCLEGYDALAYEHSILNAIFRERMPEEEERGLMKYYHKDDTINQKVQSYVFTVEQIQDQLMGVAECRVKGELTVEELKQLKDEISRQAYVFGERFDQHPIETGDGEIYVSLWSSNRGCSIMTQEELEQSQQMGGMKLE